MHPLGDKAENLRVANDWRHLLHVAGVISRGRSKDQATATEIASDPFGLSIAPEAAVRRAMRLPTPSLLYEGSLLSLRAECA
ncbi:hypothetical protein DLM45_06525 [Hyphomicrobium methylovorum]|nr:hypothetical protein [Hyphomicrobium methylovorum]